MQIMRRREFGKRLLSGAIATSAASAQETSRQSSTPKRNDLMHVGGDYHAVAGGEGITSKQNLEYNLRHGDVT